METALANEALIQPAELGGNFAVALRYEELFWYHFLEAISGTGGPADPAP